MRFMLYFGFALLSSTINLLTQSAVMSSVSVAHAYFLALLTGTAMGWIVKFALDKHCVFKHKAHSRVQLAGNMASHAGAGAFFTLIFWGIETLFHFLLPVPGAMYIGAVVGLTLCYVLRYQVDRLVVFRTQPEPT